MLFSLILPVYNTPPSYLEKCIKSIENQSYQNYEIIIVDDCSNNENTIKYLDTINNKKIKIIKNNQNIGLGPSRNVGYREALGDYIWFIDSDDWINKDSLNLVKEKIEKSNPDIIFFNFNYIYSDKIMMHLCDGAPYCTIWSKVYKMNFLRKNNLEHFESRLPHEDEYFNLLTLYHSNSYEYINDTLYFYNKMNTSSITNSVNLEESLESFVFYLKRFKEKCSYKNKKIKKDIIFQTSIYWRYCMLFNDYSFVGIFLYLRSSKLFYSLKKYVDWNLYSKPIKYIYFPVINLILFFYKKFFIK